LKRKYERLKEQVGVLGLVEGTHWHFTVRDVQRAAFRQDTANPKPGWRYFLMDFAQSPTLPLGPIEGSKWWFATARFSVCCLGFHVWGEGLGPEGKYFMYLSRVMDHTPWFVIAALGDLLGRLPNTDKVTREIWADVGPHFRAYRLGLGGAVTSHEKGLLSQELPMSHPPMARRAWTVHSAADNDGQFRPQQAGA
jgi:hypothetical protein